MLFDGAKMTLLLRLQASQLEIAEIKHAHMISPWWWKQKNKLQPKLIRWSRRVDCLCVCLPPPRMTILVFAAERRHFTEQFYDALLLLLPSATRPQQKSLVARSRGLASSPYFTTGSPERMHPLQIPLSPDYTDIRQQLFFLHGHQTTSPQNRTPYSAKRCC